MTGFGTSLARLPLMGSDGRFWIGIKGVENLHQVGGDRVQYPPKDIYWVDALDDTLRDVCVRVTQLWSVPNLPTATRHLLGTFYQRQLIFSQGDLDVLQAVEGLYLEALEQ